MDDSPFPRTTRREFLRSGGRALGFLAFSQIAPSFVTRAAALGAPPPDKDATILVLVQLAGGNDGLNTVVPFEDDRYYELRPNLGIRAADLLRIDDTAGLPASSCAELHRLHLEGKLSILRNVGYPNPNRSHFRSMEIWETASDSEDIEATGWVARFFDNACAGAPGEDPKGIYLTGQAPQVFDSDRFLNIYGASNPRGAGGEGDRELLENLARKAVAGSEAGNFLSHTYLDALAMDDRIGGILRGNRPPRFYPNSRLARSLSSVAEMIRGGLKTRVYFVSLGGFDTHSNQGNRQPALLRELSGALAAFQRDLEASRLDDQVLTMTFSEFGRRPTENESQGTDHGTAAPLFVMGSKVGQPLIGEAPSLDLPKNGDLRFETDFRSVYASVLEDWLGCEATSVLGQSYPKLPLLAKDAPT